MHLTTVYAKSIAAQFYDQNYTKAYFAGCSSGTYTVHIHRGNLTLGGKQSIRSAEQFPDDFDGVLVVHLILKFHLIPGRSRI